jgi:hypothetical protein
MEASLFICSYLARLTDTFICVDLTLILHMPDNDTCRSRGSVTIRLEVEIMLNAADIGPRTRSVGPDSNSELIEGCNERQWAYQLKSLGDFSP